MKKVYDIRVLAINASIFSRNLKKLGFEARIVKGCKTTLHNGCRDPECCDQHNSYYFPEDWRTIVTNCSGKLFHSLLVEGFLK